MHLIEEALILGAAFLDGAHPLRGNIKGKERGKEGKKRELRR